MHLPTIDMTRFISPPDMPEKMAKTVLLVDFPLSDIEQIAMYCRTTDKEYDVLLYSPEEHDRDWLDAAFMICDVCIVNLNYTINTLIKAQMVVMPKTLYVGNLDIAKKRSIASPLDFFMDDHD